VSGLNGPDCNITQESAAWVIGMADLSNLAFDHSELVLIKNSPRMRQL
jgi:hypothetical protein